MLLVRVRRQKELGISLPQAFKYVLHTNTPQKNMYTEMQRKNVTAKWFPLIYQWAARTSPSNITCNWDIIYYSIVCISNISLSCELFFFLPKRVNSNKADSNHTGPWHPLWLTILHKPDCYSISIIAGGNVPVFTHMLQTRKKFSNTATPCQYQVCQNIRNTFLTIFLILSIFHLL